MTPDLGPYAAEVLSAYAVTAVLLAAIVGWSVVRARRAAARLRGLERRAGRRG